MAEDIPIWIRECEKSFPGMELCDLLGPAYVFDSADEACRDVLGPGAVAANPTPAYNGPCAGSGGGTHWRCHIRSKYAGRTASCCPCCEEDENGVAKRKLCRSH